MLDKRTLKICIQITAVIAFSAQMYESIKKYSENPPSVLYVTENGGNIHSFIKSSDLESIHENRKSNQNFVT